MIIQKVLLPLLKLKADMTQHKTANMQSVTFIQSGFSTDVLYVLLLYSTVSITKLSSIFVVFKGKLYISFDFTVANKHALV